MSFRAGDGVMHRPSGEKWTLACDEDSGCVYPMGWPESRAQAADCDLLRAATDAQRADILTRAANLRNGDDMRARLARRQLSQHMADLHGGKP